MINYIKRIYSAYTKKSNEFVNIMDSYYLRGKISKKKVDCKLIGKSLILVPHADDEWVGCSQVIINNNSDIVLYNMDMQGGDSSDIHITRKKELEKMAYKYKLKLQDNIGKVEEKVDNLEKKIEEFKPDLIFLPFFIDWHEDHIAVMNILREALRNIPKNINIKIVMYQASVPIPEQYITTCIGMERRTQIDKWKTFRDIYPTQAFFPVKRFCCNEYINGGIINSYAAEVYSCMDINEWLSDFSIIPDRKERINIINSFRNVKKIRKCTKKLIDGE